MYCHGSLSASRPSTALKLSSVVAICCKTCVSTRGIRGALAAHSRHTHQPLLLLGPISKFACTVVRILFQLIAKYVIV